MKNAGKRIAALLIAIALLTGLSSCLPTSSQMGATEAIILSEEEQKVADAIYSGRYLWFSSRDMLLDLCVHDGNYYLAVTYYTAPKETFVGSVATVEYFIINEDEISESFSEEKITLSTWAKSIARVSLCGKETDNKELRQLVNRLASYR